MIVDKVVRMERSYLNKLVCEQLLGLEDSHGIPFFLVVDAFAYRKCAVVVTYTERLDKMEKVTWGDGVMTW